MFQRFHELKERRESGFTLIELLVVILIIAILAAIAIPVFLNQRKKGWKSQTESAVKNMATAEESWLTSSPNGEYTANLADLEDEGFTYSAADVDPAVGSVSGGTAYCVEAESVHDASIQSHYSSDAGRPDDGLCP
jgi:type IV pilus assembly protein PilA